MYPKAAQSSSEIVHPTICGYFMHNVHQIYTNIGKIHSKLV